MNWGRQVQGWSRFKCDWFNIDGKCLLFRQQLGERPSLFYTRYSWKFCVKLSARAGIEVATLKCCTNLQFHCWQSHPPLCPKARRTRRPFPWWRTNRSTDLRASSSLFPMDSPTLCCSRSTIPTMPTGVQFNVNLEFRVHVWAGTGYKLGANFITGALQGSPKECFSGCKNAIGKLRPRR